MPPQPTPIKLPKKKNNERGEEEEERRESVCVYGKKECSHPSGRFQETLKISGITELKHFLHLVFCKVYHDKV